MRPGAEAQRRAAGGALATRSPHRPCPVGLSVARVVAVRGRTLVVEGADLVDGTPVLDIKPYVPFCDAVPGAGAPAWVAPEAQEGPEALAVGRVHLDAAARASIAAAWQQAQARRRREERLYDDAEAFLQLVLATLTRDIRSVTQRQKVPRRRARGQRGAGRRGGAGAGGGLLEDPPG
ncbi:hypothetical protein QBZ16_002837 [Prototheca wickerhamii]|uniref:TsaA-like domain-containing protein n=1 Tax=Prototheca wickerhamii TaxID=3111 RepID=A0AAD9IIM7_PROWI|nr:hypothetical protein QBZ16_002837 [Prototheca wickerhamii]